MAPADFQNPPHPDLDRVQGVIRQVLSGSMGDLEDDNVEENYGAEFGADDRRHLSSVRRAVFLDAAVNCLENSPGTRDWLLRNVLEVILSESCWIVASS